jgi:hypothetical protein
MKRNLLAAIVMLAVSAVSFAADKGSAFIIKDGASLWTLKGKEMVWSASLSLGQPLVSAAKGTTKGKYEGKEFNLVKVKTDSNQEGYVIESLVARNALGLAVVTSDLATLYSAARDSAVLSTILPKMNVIAVSAVQDKPDYYSMEGYADDTGNYVSGKFILTSDVSLKPEDVNVSILLQAIKAQKKKEQKQKTAQIIAQKYRGSVFFPIVQDLITALDENIATEDYATEATVSDNLNIRDIPSVYGAVVVLVKKGEKVTAVKRTMDSFSIEKKQGKWVKVSAPAAGWVFDAYLTPADAPAADSAQ